MANVDGDKYPISKQEAIWDQVPKEGATVIVFYNEYNRLIGVTWSTYKGREQFNDAISKLREEGQDPKYFASQPMGTGDSARTQARKLAESIKKSNTDALLI